MISLAMKTEHSNNHSHDRALSPVLAILSIALALCANWLAPQAPLQAGLLFSAALGFLIWIARSQPAEAPAHTPVPASAPLLDDRWRWFSLGLSSAAAVTGYLTLAGHEFTPVNLTCWLISMLSFGLAWMDRPAPLPRPRLSPELLTLLVILVLGALLRFYRLDAVPIEMTSDHAEKLLDVSDVLQGQYPVFFTRNTGREGMQFYLTAALIRFTPLETNHLALKVGAALFGLLAIPAAWCFFRELYGPRRALLGAAVFAISGWHIAISRVGLRFPFPIPFILLALAFLIRAFKWNRVNDWLALGLMLGLGLHTYIPMRVVPLLLLLSIGLKLLFDLLARRWPDLEAGSGWQETSGLSWPFWRNALIGGAMSLLAFLPLLRYMIDRPDLFWYRAGSRVGNGMAFRQALSVFADNNVRAVLMFNVRGDTAWMNTVMNAPTLDLVSGAFFVLGAGLLIYRLLRWRDRRSIQLILVIFVLFLPSTLSLAFPIENPSVVRTGALSALACLLAADALLALLDAFFAAGAFGRRIAWALLALAFCLAGLLNFHWYFVRYDQQVQQSSWNTREMGSVLRAWVDAGGDPQQFYHVAYVHWADTRNIGINAGLIGWENALLDPAEVFDHRWQPGPKLYLLYPADSAMLGLLQGLYPDGEWREYHSSRERYGKNFLIFEAPGESP